MVARGLAPDPVSGKVQPQAGKLELARADVGRVKATGHRQGSLAMPSPLTSNPTTRSATCRSVSLGIATVLVSYLDRVTAPEIDYRAELPPHRQIAAWLQGRIDSGEL